jgi:hypothetical protein
MTSKGHHRLRAAPPTPSDVSPTTLDFGSRNVGTSSSSQQLTVTNAGGGPIKILSVAAGSDFSETDNCASSSPLAPGGTCEINVTFTPGAAGPCTGRLTIANGLTSFRRQSA